MESSASVLSEIRSCQTCGMTLLPVVSDLANQISRIRHRSFTFLAIASDILLTQISCTRSRDYPATAACCGVKNSSISWNSMISPMISFPRQTAP